MPTVDEKPPVMVTSMRVANAIRSLLSDPGLRLSTLTRAIHVEPSISAAVLRVANSAALSASAPVTGLERAVAVIGTARVRVLAIQIVMRQLIDGIEVAAARQLGETLWAHSLELACMAEQIAIARGVPGDYCHVLALFHDLPVFQLLNESRNAPDAYSSEARIVDHARRWNGPSAARVASTMGLPVELVDDLHRLDDPASTSPAVEVLRSAHACVDARYAFDRFDKHAQCELDDTLRRRAHEKMEAYLDLVRMR